MKLCRNIAYSLLATIFVGGTLPSCSDFLNEELTTQRNTDYFDTEEGIADLATGIYYNLRFHFSKEWAYATTNYGTDEFRIGGNASNAAWNSYNGSFKSQITAMPSSRGRISFLRLPSRCPSEPRSQSSESLLLKRCWSEALWSVR